MKSQSSYEQEVSAQTILWKQLKKWLQYAIILSSILVAGLYASLQMRESNTIVNFLLIVALISDCIWMLIIARSLKHGKENIEKLIQMCHKR